MVESAEHTLHHEQPLPDHHGGLLRLPEARGGTCAQARGGKRGFGRIRRAEMLPVRPWKPAARHHPLPVGLQTLCCVGAASLGTPPCKLVAASFGLPPRLRRQNLAQQRLACRLLPLRQVATIHNPVTTPLSLLFSTLKTSRRPLGTNSQKPFLKASVDQPHARSLEAPSKQANETCTRSSIASSLRRES